MYYSFQIKTKKIYVFQEGERRKTKKRAKEKEIEDEGKRSG